MNDEIKTILERHNRDIDKLNNQRQLWLYASSVVLVAVLFLIFGWDWLSSLSSRKLWWLIISSMILIAVNWWYWTMSLIKQLMEHHTNSIKVIKSLISDINAVRSDLTDIDKFD